MMSQPYLALAGAILFGAGGQVLLKSGAAASNNLMDQVLAPQSIMGLVLYAAAAICYMYTLRHIPVSIAFPTDSLAYIVVVILYQISLIRTGRPRQIPA
jgi:small multidrug resistance pump